MKVEELEEKLESAQDKLTAKLTKQHARWEQIPNQARAKKLVSMSAALAWLDRQCMFEKGTIVSSASDCTLYHGNEVVRTPTESPKELKCPERGVPDDRGKTLSPIVVENSEMADDEQEEEKERKRPDEDGDEGADTSSHPMPTTSEIRDSILERSGPEVSPLDSLTQEVYEALCEWMRTVRVEQRVTKLCNRVFTAFSTPGGADELLSNELGGLYVGLQTLHKEY